MAHRPSRLVAAILAGLLLSTACTTGDRPESLADRVPLFTLADPLQPGQWYPIFAPLLPDENPVLTAEAMLVLAAAGEPPEAVLAAVPESRSTLDRWLSRGAELSAWEASVVLAAGRAAGHQPAPAVLDRYAGRAEAALATGEPDQLYHAARIGSELAATGTPTGAAAGARIRAALNRVLGPACRGGGPPAPRTSQLGQLADRSLLLAAAAEAGASCRPPAGGPGGDRPPDAAGLARLSAGGHQPELAAALARLVNAGALPADGAVRDYLAAATAELASPPAHGDGQQCVLPLLLVAAEASGALQERLQLAEPVRGCAQRALRWRGRIPDVIADYDVVGSVYGVRALEYYATLTGRRDARAVRDAARSRLDPAGAGTGYERVVLGVAFDPAAVTPADLDRFARSTLTSHIPVHIGLVAVAAATDPDLCTDTVRDVLRRHVTRVGAELAGALEAGNLPFGYWAAVLLGRADGCIRGSAAATARAELRDRLAGLLAGPVVFGPGGSLSDPALARFGWDAACELGLDGQLRPLREQARAALTSWLPADPDTYTRPGYDLPDLYSLLRLTYLVEVGCGLDGATGGLWGRP